MFIADRRKELGLTVDELYKLSGVPRFRIRQIEAGIESVRVIPFYQAVALACALEIPLYLFYQWCMTDEYAKFLRQAPSQQNPFYDHR